MKCGKDMVVKILELNNLWDKTDQSIIADNVEKYLFQKYPECSDSFNNKINKLIEITDCKKQTVYAWLNRSRANVKVPFLKLCVIAKDLDVDIEDFFNGIDNIKTL